MSSTTLRIPKRPRSAPGFLARALAQRRRLGLPPFTVLCCDNLPSNGSTVRKVVTRLRRVDRSRPWALCGRTKWRFPRPWSIASCPRPPMANAPASQAALGLADAWPVMTEVFTQWVIEDHFPQGRPDWAATFVQDVAPFEQMKLRLLNGAHSSLAYLGYLAGHETVASAMADPALSAFVERLMDEDVTPTLAVPPGVDVRSYKQALLRRFRNPSLPHRTWQIAMDGSQKLPQRLLGTVRDRLRTGAPIACLALGIAAWMRYVTGIDETGGSDRRARSAARRIAEACRRCRA